ncbi:MULTISPECIES: hypothetical protein [Brevibacillus]|nr:MULTISPECIES: hypothetical protein [Brevibacillus]
MIDYMTSPFESFHSPLSWQQVALLLDTVEYFEEALKWLSIPDEQGASVAVPLTGDTLRVMLAALSEDDAYSRQLFSFGWLPGENEDTGTLQVGLPTGEVVEKSVVLSQFSPV